MRVVAILVVVLCGCGAPSKPGAAPIAGTQGMVAQGAPHGDNADTGDDDSGSSSAQGSSSTGASTGDSGNGTADSSSSGGALACMMDGEPCDTDGVCIGLDQGWGCGHGMPGDPCAEPPDCPDGTCNLVPASLGVPGVCTGQICDATGIPCEDDGTCVDLPDGMLLCSHGQAGEPCMADGSCASGTCENYSGGVSLCT